MTTQWDTLKATLAKASGGEWAVGPVDDTVVTHIGADGLRYEVASIDGDYNEPETWPIMEANAAAIVAAHNALRPGGWLHTAHEEALATVAAQAAEIERLKSEVRRLQTPSGYWFTDDREYGHAEIDDLLEEAARAALGEAA